jgi:hypothetical protein
MKSLKLGLVAVLAAACGTVVGSRYVKSAPVTASSGAVISVTATDSAALAGTSLSIPAGALSADTTITVEPGLLPLVTDGEALSPVVEWGPSGLVFSTPATMTLPLTLSLSDQASDLEVVVEEADGTVKAIATVTLDATRTRASFKVSGFSSYQVRRRHAACTTNAQCASTQTCVSGTCRTTQTDGGVAGACVTNADCGSTQQCANGTCVLRCSLTPEVCGDGIDNNCNGVVDEGCPVDGGMMTCASNANCASGQTCTSGTCVDLDGGIDGGPAVCRVDTDCVAGESCVNGLCERLVDGGIDAGPVDGGPIDGGPPDSGLVCRVDTDCASFEACISGVCQVVDGGIDAGPVDAGQGDGGIDAGPADGGVCRTNLDCLTGQLCIAGTCQ